MAGSLPETNQQKGRERRGADEDDTTENKMAANPRCFFDISIEGTDIGRVIFELFADVVPKTAEKLVPFPPPSPSLFHHAN